MSESIKWKYRFTLSATKINGDPQNAHKNEPCVQINKMLDKRILTVRF